MAQLRTELRRTALSIIRDFGEKGTLRSVTVGAYDPQSGAAAKTYADYEVTVVIVQFKRGETETGIVTKDDRKAYVASPVPLDPKHEDLLIFSGSTVKVSRVMEVLDGVGGGLLYVLAVRG